MRKWRAARLIVVALVSFVPESARAMPVVDLIFTNSSGAGAPGDSTIAAAYGDVLTLEIRLTADDAGISSYGISIQFDGDLGNEFDLVGATENLPNGFAFNLNSGVNSTQESTDSQAGSVLTFEAGTFGLGPISSVIVIGIVQFTITTNVATDGIDIVSGVLNSGIDDVFDNEGFNTSQTVVFNGASMNVPEPSFLALVGLLAASVFRLRTSLAS